MDDTTSVGQIGLDLVVNHSLFKAQMEGITRIAKKTGKILAGAFAVKSIKDFGTKCLELGSDLAEVQNVVDVTFPHMTAQVDKFAQSAAQSFGLSETMAKQYTGTFGAMAKAFGFTEKEAYDMASTLTGLTGDVASFYNLNQDEAYTKLKSVFTGETESLKDLGVVMTQTALDAYAMANGYGKTTSAMTEAEKVSLRYAFVQDQLSAATGDFVRTSGSWANQVRIMKLQMESFMATVGQGLINLFTPALKMINALIGKLATLANAFKSFTELITGQKSSGTSQIAAPVADLTDTADEAESGLESAAGAADNLNSSTKKAGDAAQKAAKKMKSLMGFDKINRLDAPATSTSGTSSGNTGTGSGAGQQLGQSVDFGNLAQGEDVIDKVDNKFTKMFENITRLAQPATDALKRLWSDGLAKLGNFSANALKDFYQSFLVPVGKWVLGKGIPEFVNALNDGLSNVHYEVIQNGLHNLWLVLTPFATNVGEGLLWFWKNVLVPLGTWTANEVVPRFLDTLRIAIEAFNNIITALQPLFQWFWDSVLQPIANWVANSFLGEWDNINQKLQAFSDWCAENPGIIQAVTTVALSFAAAWGVVTAAMSAWNAIALITNTVITGLGAAIGFLTSPIGIAIVAITALIAGGIALYKNWDKISAKLKKIWEGIQKFAGEIWGGIKDTISKVHDAIANVLSVVWEKITSTLSTVWNNLKSTVESVFGSIRDKISEVWATISETGKKIWDGIHDTISGILNKIADTASSVGSRISNALVGAFQNILKLIKVPINGIIGLINGLIKGVVTGINYVLQAFNKLRISIPRWVPGIGGNTLGFNFATLNAPQIPKLAEGGYVKPNTPQLAMIGDNRHQGEVVAPEKKLKQMAAEAVREAGGTGITKADLERVMNNAVMRIVAALTGMGFYLDGEQMAKVIKAVEKAMDIRFNPVSVE
ncbi:Phage-related protein [uncultured Clostridium sp.]|uniref:Phage-related protein n=1 Tax=Muricoprocola aceti TaxID=2981772 RepID=A0ABT2SP17_9FIRM|nr:hypothetical protein [Muricoprocola aceti]MCU6725778.1 hypothetical protein [Muricoprocola aceti]SCH64098.1 Phage-related protein [uncultured Clostridium sp.]